jgi:calcineurin-like phosphoesterase family protein
MANFYISDLHFGHANIMRHSKRNFKDVDEMDEVFIKNWNSVVTDKDDVYIVGDFSLKSARNPIEYLRALKGKKHLITGNHDSHLLKQAPIRALFVSISDIKKVHDDGDTIILCHYPMVEWDGFFRGALHFYGHIHNNNENASNKIMKQIKNAYNVGTDILGYFPRKKEEVIECNKKFNENE